MLLWIPVLIGVLVGCIMFLWAYSYPWQMAGRSAPHSGRIEIGIFSLVISPVVGGAFRMFYAATNNDPIINQTLARVLIYSTIAIGLALWICWLFICSVVGRMV